MSDARTIGAAEIEAWVRQMGVGFHFEIAPGYPEYVLGTVDLERTWASVDGDRIVGTLRSLRTALTVPGPRQLPASALTNVTVAPTHRRQGRLTAMIDADLRASADRGEAVSILIASEYPIYGRFGYGPAVEGANYTVRTDDARFRTSPEGTVELTDRVTLRRVGPAIYERFRSAQAGSIERPPHWWDRRLRQVEVPGDEPMKGQVALYSSPDGELEGYAIYEAKQDWDGMRPQGVLTLNELVATTSDAYHALWSYCCGVDLLRTIEASVRPTDELLPHLLDDARAVKQTARFDFMWVRILDVRVALGSRAYSFPGRLVIEVVDELGIAGGRYVLDAEPGGSTCVVSTEPPDITVPVDMLGSLYMGATSAQALEDAGRIATHRLDVAATVDAMFRVGRAPWCNTWF